MAPVFLAVGVMVAGAVFVAAKQSQADKKEAAETAEPAVEPQKNNPFADRDNSPPARGERASSMKNTAPPGLMEEPIWVNAKVLGDKGMKLVKEAQAARKAGDEDAYQKKGYEGRELLDQALMATGDWLIDLSEAHPNDRTVNGIAEMRFRWAKEQNKMRKVKGE